MLLVRNKTDRPLIGISAVVAGLFLFSLQDVVIKYFSSEHSVLQIVIIRGISAVLVVGCVLLCLHGVRGFIVRYPVVIFSKGLLGFLSYLVYYMAIASLPLAEVVAITFSAPIMVTVLSSVMLSEPIGIRRWCAVLAGFIAVLIIVGPGGKMANIAVSFAALAAFSYALSSVIARCIGPDDKPWTVTFYFTVAHLLGGVIVSIFMLAWGPLIEFDHPSVEFLTRPWSMGNATAVLTMIALGINAALGFYFLNKAYLSTPASTVAPFEYSYILWAILFGYLFWGEIPQFSTLLGVLLLIGSNLYIIHREIINKRRQREPKVAPGDRLVTEGSL